MFSDDPADFEQRVVDDVLRRTLEKDALARLVRTSGAVAIALCDRASSHHGQTPPTLMSARRG